MAASNKKFTQRLSVRLAAVFTVVALGAIAIAHGQWAGSRTVAEPAAPATPAAGPAAAEAIQPIPIPADEVAELPAAASRRWEPHQGFAALPEAPARSSPATASTMRLVPEEQTLIVRAKNDQDASRLGRRRVSARSGV
jgi:hypothetical protein